MTGRTRYVWRVAASRDRGTPGRAVTSAVLLAAGLLALVDLGMTGRLSQFFDLSFIVVCTVAALAVRGSELFTVAVLPPLVMVVVLAMLTVVEPLSLTGEHLGLASTLLTGLAHHAGALVAAHGAVLAIVAARSTLGGPAGAQPVRRGEVARRSRSH